MNERGLSGDHTTIYPWVQDYAPELEKRIRPHLRLTNDSYRVDETYVKIKGEWSYLYRAVDSNGPRAFSLLLRLDKLHRNRLSIELRFRVSRAAISHDDRFRGVDLAAVD